MYHLVITNNVNHFISITYKSYLELIMKIHLKIALFLSGTILVASPVFADESDPLEQLLNAHAIFDNTVSASIEYARPTAASTQVRLDALDRFMQDEIKRSINDIDPLANLIQEEGVLETDDLRQSVANAAFNYLNIPYKFGGNDYINGYDCSGLVRAIFLEITNKSLPRTSAAQAAATRTIRRAELEPGDLVFFNTSGKRQFSHVGIYVGNDQFIHAPRTGAQIRIENITQRYWNTRFTGARRVIE